MHGIDAVVLQGEFRIALQMKKETYRAEARGAGRFVQKHLRASLLLELPYTVVPPDEWRRRKEKARNDITKEQYTLFEWLAGSLQRWLPNGFVVFDKSYPLLVEELITTTLSSDYAQQAIPLQMNWGEVLKRLHAVPQGTST